MNKEEMIQSQLSSFNRSLDMIKVMYAQLVEDMYNDNLPRDKYMVYDMMDMVIFIESILREVTSICIDSGYMVEKLDKIKSYIDTTLKYFKQ